MKIKYRAAAVGIAAAGAAALVLAGCGSDNNSTPSSSGGSSTTSCRGSNISCQSGTLTSGGSTAQQNAISAWSKAYETACSGATINYQGVGSGAGVTQFSSGTLDFAGSDFALDSIEPVGADARCKSGPAINIPLAPGGIAIGYNIPNVTKLNLSASNLAKIFSGKITNWNDPSIAKDNSGTTLPNLPIQTFHRSDSSGTSYNFTNYLANDAKSDWTVGANKNWPAPGGQGEHGSSLVASTVKATPGGIGYFEQSFATQNNLPMAAVGNPAGQFVSLTTANVANFLAKATDRRHRQRPEAEVRLRRHGRQRVPERAGDLRDRLLEGQRLDQAPADQGLPRLRGQHRGPEHADQPGLRPAAGRPADQGRCRGRRRSADPS